MSKRSHRNKNGGDDAANYVNEQDVARQVRDEKLCINDDDSEGEAERADRATFNPNAPRGNPVVNDADVDPSIDSSTTAKRLQQDAGYTSPADVDRYTKDPLGYYKVMGVSPSADAHAIRRAFLSLSQSYHSDKHSQQDELAQTYMNERFQQLTEAYEVLSDPRRRAAYDHSGGAGIARLELVPMSAVNPIEVKKYLTLLQAEAQLKRAERLIASSSNATIHISAAHHFSSLKALGLADDEEDKAGEGDQQQQANAQQQKRRQQLMQQNRPNIDAFADDKNKEKKMEQSAPTTTEGTEASSGGVTSSSSSSSSSALDEAADRLASATTAEDEQLDDEILQRRAQHEAYMLHQRLEAEENKRLRESLEKAPPRWDPSHRGFGIDHNFQKRKEVEDAQKAAEEERRRLQQQAEEEEAAAAKKQKEEAEEKQKKEAEQQHQQQQQQQQTPQHTAAQLAEVMINGQPTLVAILPAHVAQQFRAQMGGKGVIANEGAQGGAGSNGDAPAGASSEQQAQQQQQQKGILRRGPSAQAQQALQQMPFMALLSLDFVHMYNYPIGEKTNLTFRTAAKKNAQGNGSGDGSNVSVTLERVLSPLSKFKVTLKGTFSLLRLQVGYTRVLSVATTLTNKLTLYNGGQLLRDFSMSLTRRLSAAMTLTNTLTLTTARGGGNLVSSLQYVLSDHQLIACSQEIGFGSWGYGFNYVAKLNKKVKATISLRSQLLGGVSECAYEVWYMRNQLEQIGVGASVAIPYSYNVFTGVVSNPQPTRLTQFFILLGRGDHSIRIPIVVVVNDHVAKLLAFGAIPALCLSIGRIATRPFANLHKAKAYQRARSLHVKSVALARRKAEIEMMTLHSVVAKKRATEEVVNGGGLVIVKASYGVLHPKVAVLPPIVEVIDNLMSPLSATNLPPADTPFEAPEEFSLTHDVTDALQSLVHNSALVLAEGPKDTLAGFFDIDPGTDEKKFISVIYLFRKRLHKVEVGADEALTLPMEEHLDVTAAAANPTA